MTIEEQPEGLDLRAKLAHIDQMLPGHDKNRWQLAGWQEIDWDRVQVARWQQGMWFALTGMGAGAALFATGAALIKIFSC